MGKIYFPKPVKLIISMISSNKTMFDIYEEILKKRFGRTDLKSNIQDFNFTKYYEKEFGQNLLEKIISFESLIKIEMLTDIKKITNGLENDILDNNISSKKRNINLDPGYINLDKFILASTKNGPSRIYLKDGIYAEITLKYQNKSFVANNKYTYPNYRTDEYINFLNLVREKYKQQLRKYFKPVNSQ
ncbi:MAG: DUF4416 family protein [Candidatus Caldatribacteriota bacterium]|nr:DUF4416 family protein [Candidatus Caldatribacteriota bacterium]